MLSQPLHRMDAIFGPPGQTSIRIPAFNHSSGFGDGKHASGFSAGHRVGWTLCPVHDGDMTRRHIGQVLQHPKGGQAFHAFAAPALHIHHAIWRGNGHGAAQFFDVRGNQSRPKLAPQTQRIGDGGFVGMGGGGSELGMSDGRVGRGQGRLDVGAHHLDGFAVAFGNHVSNVEAVRGDLTGQFGGEPQSGVLGCRLREGCVGLERG